MAKLLTDAEVEEIRQSARHETRVTLLRSWLDQLMADRDARRKLERKGKT